MYTYTYIYSSSIRVHRPSPTTDASLQGRPTAMAGGVVLCSGCAAAPQANWNSQLCNGNPRHYCEPETDHHVIIVV